MDSKLKWLTLLCAFSALTARAQNITTGLVQTATFSFVSNVQTTNTHLREFSINNKTLIDFLRGATNTTTQVVSNDDGTFVTNTVPETNGIPLNFVSSPKIVAKILTNSQTYQFFIRDTVSHEPVDYDISSFFQYKTNALVSQRNGTSSNDLVRVGLVMATPGLSFDADSIGKQVRTTNSPSGSNPGGLIVRSLTASCLGSGSVTNDAPFVTNTPSGKPSHIPPAGPMVFSGRFNMTGGKFEPITNGIP